MAVNLSVKVALQLQSGLEVQPKDRFPPHQAYRPLNTTPTYKTTQPPYILQYKMNRIFIQMNL